ncbi:hypothetical protein [Haloarchaeobius amylolyticus]|uniref:hypothetical protein n=1 Tax=Haloarchaeobius amylolyticus TaxID=1198296 RepID=UPI002271DA94|nr:hypothetical protein [Haloarchaeobius amylolyticus]
MVAGLDIGTAVLTAARAGDGDATLTTAGASVVAVPTATLTDAGFDPADLCCIERDDTVFVLGGDASTVAEATDADPEPLFSNDVVIPREHDAALIGALADDVLAGDEGEAVCFTTPGRFLDADEPTTDHREAVAEGLSGEGYDPTPVNTGLAVLYDALSDGNYTGLGVAVRPAVTTVCLAFYGVPVLGFSLGKGRDWLVEQAAAESGESVEAVADAREEFTLGLDTSSDGVEGALADAYNDLLADVSAAIQREADEGDLQSGVAATVVVAGSGSVPGMEMLLGAQLDAAPLPFSVDDVRLADDPANSAALGALAAAESGVDGDEGIAASEEEESGDGDAGEDSQQSLTAASASTTATAAAGTNDTSPPPARGDPEGESSNRAIEQMFERLGNREDEIASIREDLDTAAADLDSLRDDLAALDASAATTDDLDSVAGDLDSLRDDLAALDASAATTDDLAADVAEVTASVDDVRADVETLQAGQESLTSRADEAATERETQAASIDEVESAVDALEQDTDSLADDLESVDESVDAVRADLTDARDRLDRLAETAAETDEVASLSQDLAALAERVETLADEGATDEDLQALRSDVLEVDMAIADLQESFADLEAGSADAETVAALRERTATVEDEVETVEERVTEDVDSVGEEVAAVRDEVDSLATQLATLDDALEEDVPDAETVSAVENAVEETDAAVADLESDLSSVRERLEEQAAATPDADDLDDLAGDVSRLRADLNALEESVAAVEAELDDGDPVTTEDLAELATRLEDVAAATADADAVTDLRDSHSSLSARLDDLEADVVTGEDLDSLREELVTADDLADVRDSMLTGEELTALEDRLATAEALDALESRVVTEDRFADLRESVATEQDLADLRHAVEDLREEREATTDPADGPARAGFLDRFGVGLGGGAVVAGVLTLANSVSGQGMAMAVGGGALVLGLALVAVVYMGSEDAVAAE